MIERPRTHNQEAAEETGNRYLANLGLEWTELQGKKVLDIGALNAEFEHAARQRGIDVISVDKEVVEGEYMPPLDSKFVVANATRMPFKDESFDYALAHMSVMNYIEKEYEDTDYLRYVEDVLREVCRVLKSEGQFRFTDTVIDDMEREHQILEELAKRVGFRELQLEKYPNSHPEKDEYRLLHYYIALK